MNADLQLDPVTICGYSQRDLQMYYSGTILLDSDRCPVLVEEAFLNSDWIVRGEDEELRATSYRDLSRFVIPFGYYIDRSGSLFSIDISPTSGYKKGMTIDGVRLGIEDNQTVLEYIADAVEDYHSECEDTFIISRRLAVHSGKVWSFHKDLTVGSYIDGTFDTPFNHIKERLVHV